jgi:hypothetical protein
VPGAGPPPPAPGARPAPTPTSPGDDLSDPVRSATFFGVWKRAAAFNTRIFERVFPGIPSNRMRRFADIGTGWRGTWDAAEPTEANRRELEKVRGVLCEYPTGWLAEQDLRPSLLYGDSAALVSNAVFT